MDTRLYIGNMSKETTEEDLRTMFSEAGTVALVEVVMDHKSGSPRGFAFVTMSNEAEAEKAVQMFNGKEVNFHTLKVNISLPRIEPPGPGSASNKQ